MRRVTNVPMPSPGVSDPSKFFRTPLSRRAALAGSAATLAGARTINRIVPSSSATFNDAHVHLFNMADLPAGNFLKYVAIPQKFPNAPGWAAAIVDLVAEVLRFLAPTAEQELRSIDAGTNFFEVTPEKFGEAVAAHIRS